jgi:hypothetical protein
MGGWQHTSATKRCELNVIKSRIGIFVDSGLDGKKLCCEYPASTNQS